jgi:hypothetical protein
MSKYEYECALSGIVAPGSLDFSKDGLEDLPVGWSEIRMSRRVFNPKWVLIQQVKRAMIDGLLAQFPDAAKEGQGVAIRLQVDAQFYTMEQDTPAYLTEVETVYVAPRELSEDVAEAYDEAREMLGLDPLEDEAEDENEEDAAPEPEPEPEPKKKPAAKKKPPAKKAEASTAG